MHLHSQTLLMLPFLLPVVVAAESLPDPTRPYGHDAQPETIIIEEPSSGPGVTWNLTGIRIAADRRSAILNGRIVRVGDRVDGAEVLEIDPAGVLIRHENQRIRLNLIDVDVRGKADKVAQTGPEEEPPPK